MNILKDIFGKKDTKIASSEIAISHNGNNSTLNAVTLDYTGENERGRWTRFSDGTLIQYCSKVVTNAPNAQIGSIWRSTPSFIEYPIVFATTKTPAVVVSIDSDTGFAWAGLGDKAAGNAGVSVCIFAPQKSENTSKISLVAIGRWK